MPRDPLLFSAPLLARLNERRGKRLKRVAFFDGLMTGEIDALIGSFAGEPEVHQPVRERLKGTSAFARFVTDTTSWMAERNVTAENINFIITPAAEVGEFVLHLDGDAGRIELPLALATDFDQDDRMIELRMYFSEWPLTGGHRVRPPLLQPDLDLHEPDVVSDYQRALAARDRGTPPADRAPVQIIAGGRDRVVPLVNAEFLAERLPHSTLTMVDAGHFVWEEAPGEYASIVTDWVERRSP
jgi:pimeloyl-ACP methyl ester carboxylesterase